MSFALWQFHKVKLNKCKAFKNGNQKGEKKHHCVWYRCECKVIRKVQTKKWKGKFRFNIILYHSTVSVKATPSQAVKCNSNKIKEQNVGNCYLRGEEPSFTSDTNTGRTAKIIPELQWCKEIWKNSSNELCIQLDLSCSQQPDCRLYRQINQAWHPP